ncbi:hypothetical protein DWU98_09915 [Dyella monticola]|uniref:Uncharacterized protein n=1 Tax=Dyella monticola TaxID=1927958 RepID=A0A370X013_9GAMM|nr:hypothetical protein [Dyella monticola]RDS81545.1 hypothetical protein DWU98_09915 [Dyella monticola]
MIRRRGPGYELLRYGRVLGPDALHPDDRDSSEVYYLTGNGSRRGWINLSDEAIHAGWRKG